MAKKEQETLKVQNYTLTSSRKFREARFNHPNDDVAMLTQYDRKMGAIFQDGKKLENGIFWDFQENKPKHSVEKQEEVKEEAPKKVAKKATKKK